MLKITKYIVIKTSKVDVLSPAVDSNPDTYSIIIKYFIPFYRYFIDIFFDIETIELNKLYAVSKYIGKKDSTHNKQGYRRIDSDYKYLVGA